ncbi:uncharacterized protein K460DRAFT_376305 [Cucurbitaria berberidis CBS 394.84]|uniref:Uncharacterized protein n=1 Tax=Cucurbitaria berberidis CBS 394.84 TaxID=1168544 RepID=A0A9P4GEQ5_9PLEO|nr:uncharacterized protein K460DRAFT_376305 [Cucurbitaria berberidis CBS 394.84]KAF1844653.1 hypothetical protein K460DRAFT_376305 [Cucurbitaria berberidis CBS 394.84]
MPESSSLATSPQNLHAISQTLLSKTKLVHPPQKAQINPVTTAVIADLHLHPTLEATLHILNHDLPSAHFLVRHMQAPPAVEGMLLHGILHRAEGDFDNARAWIGDVGDACAGFVPKRRGQSERLESEVYERIGSGEGANAQTSLISFVYSDEEEEGMKLIRDVEVFRGKKGRERLHGEEEQIEERIRMELSRVMEWSGSKFGDGEVLDARSAWVKNSDDITSMSNAMVSGDMGWRKF